MKQLTLKKNVVRIGPRERALTDAQRRGTACIDCRSTEPPLAAAGLIYTRSGHRGRLGWLVVACAEHAAAAR